MAQEGSDPIERWTAKRHRATQLVQRRGRTEPPWLEQLRDWIQQHPTFGYRRLWALMRFQDRIVINRKAVYRMLKQQGWFVHQKRIATPRPRGQGWVSRASRSNERWAMDVTHIACGQEGWGHLAAVIDCHDREVIGYEFALRSRAKEAERAIEAACLQRFGTLRPAGAPVLRSDNGLSAPNHSGLGAVVQPGAATSSPWAPKSRPIPRTTSNPGGLISGEHYTKPVSHSLHIFQQVSSPSSEATRQGTLYEIRICASFYRRTEPENYEKFDFG